MYYLIRFGSWNKTNIEVENQTPKPKRERKDIEDNFGKKILDDLGVYLIRFASWNKTNIEVENPTPKPKREKI